jgi:acyl-CoA thioester hydrolase
MPNTRRHFAGQSAYQGNSEKAEIQQRICRQMRAFLPPALAGHDFSELPMPFDLTRGLSPLPARMAKPVRTQRGDYRYFAPITTRWSDNDIYGHVNNVIYYSYFDSVANLYLIREAGLKIHSDTTVGFVVASGCNYFAPVAYPDKLEGGLRVNKLSGSSVEYGVAIFRAGEDAAVADGFFTHVFVDRAAGKPTRIPEQMRAALEKIAVG